MRAIPITPPDARAGSSSRSSSPPGSGGGDFAALLDQTTARTAPAEGPETRPATPDAPAPRSDGQAPEDDAAGTPAQDPGAALLAALAGPAAAPPAPTTAPPSAGSATAPSGTPGLPVAPVPSGGAPASPAAAAPQAAEDGVVTAQPITLPGDGRLPGAAPAPAAPAATPTPGNGAGDSGRHHPGNGRREGAPAVPALPGTPDPAAAAAPAAPPPADAPTATPTGDAVQAAAPAPAAAAPAPPPSTAAAPAAPTPAAVVPAPALTPASLHGTVDRIHDLVRIVGLRNGGARATLQLKPVELGLVDVHLRTTRNGLVATISAQDAAGLSALQQAGSELRRSLEERGVTLARLDLQLSSSGQDGRGPGGGAADRSSSGNRRGSGALADPGAEEILGDELTITTVTSAPTGALVDVQA
jgi:hypothetical protein